MSDIPTYKEYLFHQDGRYVRIGGQYFFIVNSKQLVYLWAVCFGVLLTVIGGILLWMFDIPEGEDV